MSIDVGSTRNEATVLVIDDAPQSLAIIVETLQQRYRAGRRGPGCRRGARPCRQQRHLEKARGDLERMIPLLQQVVHQTRERIFKGNTHVPGKLVSVFEPHTEVIRKGKAAKPTEFGKMVKIQEAECQIVTHYEVFAERPSDSDLLVSAIELHERLLGRTPYLMTADAAFFSLANERAAQQRGVKRVAVPNRSTKSAQRKRIEKKRWFRNAQKWRTGSEGRISLLKRRHGLNRCRYKGMPARHWRFSGRHPQGHFCAGK